MRNKRSKKRFYLTGFLASILITSPSIANPSIIGPRENINEGSLANNYPMKISDMIDKKSWMNQCIYEAIGPIVDPSGLSGRNVCNCLWNKLESVWYDASSQVETNSAAYLCVLEQMKETMPY